MVEFDLYPGTTLFVLGGKDVGDSMGPVIEGDASSWLLAHSAHPVNFSFSASHDYENHVTAAEIDLRAVIMSTRVLPDNRRRRGDFTRAVGFGLTDPNGMPRGALVVPLDDSMPTNGPALGLSDVNGKTRAYVAVNNSITTGYAAFGLNEPNQLPRAFLSEPLDDAVSRNGIAAGPGLNLYDVNGNPRAVNER